MTAFNIRNMPLELRRQLKIKAAQAGKTMEQLAVEAIRKEVTKC